MRLDHLLCRRSSRVVHLLLQLPPPFDAHVAEGGLGWLPAVAEVGPPVEQLRQPHLPRPWRQHRPQLPPLLQLLEEWGLEGVLLRQAGVRVADPLVQRVSLARRWKPQPRGPPFRVVHAHAAHVEPPQELRLLREHTPLEPFFPPVVATERPRPRGLLLLPRGAGVLWRVVGVLGAALGVGQFPPPARGVVRVRLLPRTTAATPILTHLRLPDGQAGDLHRWPLALSQQLRDRAAHVLGPSLDCVEP